MAAGTIVPIPGRYRQGAWTLVEVLIILAVVSILITAAVPPMQDFITHNRMSTAVNTFISSLYLARSEAVKRAQNVKVCPTTDYVKCTGGSDWDPGWMVFLDVNDNDSVDLISDVVLQQNPALPSRFRIIGSGGRSDAVFHSTGHAAGSNNTFKFCDTREVANTRKVYLSNEGRIRLEHMTTSGC
jgi:type IV fimbrial biogenesis protein FimT